MIPEAQLETWSHQGATTTSALTYNSIQAALDEFAWPSGVRYEVYLQGSYRNSTNVHGDSDVDIVVELTSTFYCNLTQLDLLIRGVPQPTYTWNDFRNHAGKALQSYFGNGTVDTSGAKAIRVLADSGRLAADVVVSAQYQLYYEGRLVAVGIILWNTQSGEQIVNYPKYHYDNGVAKNSTFQTNGWFRPTVRIFKNARTKAAESRSNLLMRSPSYFLEGLLYNVADNCFGSTYQITFARILGDLSQSMADPNKILWCQNGVLPLIGSSSVQWSPMDAAYTVESLIELWNHW